MWHQYDDMRTYSAVYEWPIYEVQRKHVTIICVSSRELHGEVHKLQLTTVTSKVYKLASENNQEEELKTISK